MTTPALRKRLDKIKPPAPATPYTAPATDPRTLASMGQYLAEGRVTVPGVSAAVQQAMDEFLAGNSPPRPC